MADKELGILVRAKGTAAASAGIKSVDNSINSLTSRAGAFATKLRSNVGSALTTFGGRLKQAAFGVAAFAGVGGLLGLGGALEKSLGKAQEWGAAIEKLGPITGNTAEQLSGLLAVTERFGIDAARLTRIAGFESKAVEALALSTKGATKFQKAYGFSILDAHGKVKDFSTLLLTFSDYYRKNTNEAQKNAAAAKLFGRSYTDLVPVLNLGKKGIQDAEAEAKALGLTLTQDNVVALAKAREATRKWGDAVGGLELQLGLTLLPTLSDVAKAATDFVSSHRGDIVSFFKNAADMARTAAGTIGNFVGAVSGFWNAIPAGFRDLLIKGIVADRAVKFLFGFSPVGSIFSGLAGALSKGIGQTIGSSITGTLLGGVQKVFVVNMGVGGLGGGLAGAAGGGKIGLLGFLGLAGIGVVVAEVLHQAGLDKPIQDFADQYKSGAVQVDANGNAVTKNVGTLTKLPDPIPAIKRETAQIELVKAGVHNLAGPVGKAQLAAIHKTEAAVKAANAKAAMQRAAAQTALVNAGVHNLAGTVRSGNAAIIAAQNATTAAVLGLKALRLVIGGAALAGAAAGAFASNTTTSGYPHPVNDTGGAGK